MTTITTITKGTKIKAAGYTWTVLGAANGRYIITTGKHRMTIPCHECHADLASGKAVIL